MGDRFRGDSKRVSAITRGSASECASSVAHRARRSSPWPSAVPLVHKDRDLDEARKVYWNVILPLVDFMARTSNTTGVIKAGLRAQGLPVGVPRAPGRDLESDDLAGFDKALEQLVPYVV